MSSSYSGETFGASHAEAPPLLLQVRRHARRHRGRHEFRDKPEAEQETQAEKADEEAPPLPAKRPVFPGEKPRTASRNDAPPPNSGPSPPVSGEPYGPPPPPAAWSEAEIETGRMDCARLLDGLDVIFKELRPIKEGACGAPAPIELKGFGSEKAPPLEFHPPATMTCKLAAALRRWFDDVVQPKAKAHLDATVIRMNNASAYVCRTRYDDPTQRISQHAYANALDVTEFVTAKGESIGVLDHWNAGDERAAFLREVHDGACQIFGTVLGPEANAAHKNHFHLDMTERRHNLCDFTPGQLASRKAMASHASLTANPPPPVKPEKQVAASEQKQDTPPAPKKAGTQDTKPKEEAEKLDSRRRHRHRRRYD